MKCHYTYDKEVGKVLIPGCWAAALSGDIEDCTCFPNRTTLADSSLPSEAIYVSSDLAKLLPKKDDNSVEIFYKNKSIPVHEHPLLDKNSIIAVGSIARQLIKTLKEKLQNEQTIQRQSNL